MPFIVDWYGFDWHLHVVCSKLEKLGVRHSGGGGGHSTFFDGCATRVSKSGLGKLIFHEKWGVLRPGGTDLERGYGDVWP